MPGLAKLRIQHVSLHCAGNVSSTNDRTKLQVNPP